MRTHEGAVRTRIALGLALLVGAGAATFQAQPAGTPGITRASLFDNARASVLRVSLAPGAREVEHTHPNDVLIIQDKAGEVELMVDGKVTRGRIEPGKVTLVAKGVKHWAANTGREPFDFIVVHLK